MSTVFLITVDAGQVRLQGHHIVAQGLDPVGIGGTANDYHGTVGGSGHMRGPGVVGDQQAGGFT